MDAVSKAKSVFVVHLLDRVGYKQDMVQRRRQTWELFSKNTNTPLHSIVVAGSKGEGLTSYVESDVDTLMLDGNYLCCESGYEQPSVNTQAKIVTMQNDLCSPGYALLFMPIESSMSKVRGQILPFERATASGSQDEGHESYMCVSSSISLNESDKLSLRMSDLGMQGITEVQEQRAGPSLPFILSRGYASANFDKVLSLKSHCPAILHDWLSVEDRTTGRPGN